MNMREKMARAMFSRYANINGYVVPSILPQSKLEWWMEMTDAALDALMGAPVETLIVGESVVTGSYGDAPDFSSAWVATIRAIKEGK